MKKNIALTGYKGCGKDTCGVSLRHTHGYAQISFADPIREIAGIVFDLTEEEMQDRVLKETPLTRWPYKSPREILRDIGMMFREKYPGVWIEVYRRIRDEWNYFGIPTVLTDLRFQDEEEACREDGVVIIRIVRPETDDTQDPHPSEAYIGKIVPDHVIVNDGTLQDLQNKILTIVKDL